MAKATTATAKTDDDDDDNKMRSDTRITGSKAHTPAVVVAVVAVALVMMICDLEALIVLSGPEKSV